MYANTQQLSAPLAAVDPMPWINRFRFIEARVTRLQRQGRLQMSFQETGAMSAAKRARFIKRFIAPMMTHDHARQLLVHVNRSPHPVSIAWSNGNFGFNGTIAFDRAQAVGGQGSGAVVFIDENAPDWTNLRTVAANPDVGLYHELLHVRHIQRGTVVNDEREMERRVIGIGRHSGVKGTENHYRGERGLPLRCCWDRESLQGGDWPARPSLNGAPGLGQPAVPAGFPDAERDMVASAAKGDVSNANALADQVFFARHPDRQGRRIDAKSEPALAAEWQQIKAQLVAPILAAIAANELGKQAMYKDQPALAMSHFDRARRVAIAPASLRAGATLNLGLAQLKRKRFAAALGYFEIVRAFAGIPDALRQKAEKLSQQARVEYGKAIP